jgi:hypothetical protein
MNLKTAVRWWPAIGLLAMAVLGLLVGRGSTFIDDLFIRFGHSHQRANVLLLFTEARLVVLLYLVAVAIALFRRSWRLAIIALATPIVAVAAVRILKLVFGREKEGALAYPSGHVTVTSVVLGLLVLTLGARVWMFVAAAAFALVGLLGQALTYHYFTDTIGALFLGTALVCLAALGAGLDRCQPRCDPRHIDG